MKSLLKNNLYLALIHYPVLNKKGDTIASALTTIDLHDIARAAKTFGLEKFYVVTPFEDQKKLAKEIILHWTKGVGARLNPFRKQAIELIKVVSSFNDVKKDIQKKRGKLVISIATSAVYHNNSISIKKFAKKLDNKISYIITFGTAWGLSMDFIKECNFILEPINGLDSYNHLSVRSAVSIILDRICLNKL